MYLTVMDESVVSVKNDFSGKDEDHDVWIYHHDGYVTQTLLNTPPLLNITLLPCPTGFILLGNPPGCDCYPILTKNRINCQFINRIGYLSWSVPILSLIHI